MRQSDTFSRDVRWKKIRDFKKEHKFFREWSTGRIAIADRSGFWPEETDDGVLFLDLSRKIKLTREGLAWVPLVNQDGDELSTIAGPNSGEYSYLCGLWSVHYAEDEFILDVKEAS